MEIEIIFGLVGCIGTFVAIYQWGTLNETKKRKRELQYILASLNNSALQKQNSWQNQISALPNPSNEQEWEMLKVHMRARDSFAELSQQLTAMEGIIDTEYSAIEKMTERSLKAVKQGKEIDKAMNKLNPSPSQNETQ